MIGVDEMLKRGLYRWKEAGSDRRQRRRCAHRLDRRTHRTVCPPRWAQRDIANWADWWYTADFAQFEPTWVQGPSLQGNAGFCNRSPITYIEKGQTPLMLVLGEADYRTPPDAGGEQMFRAL